MIGYFNVFCRAKLTVNQLYYHTNNISSLIIVSHDLFINYYGDNNVLCDNHDTKVIVIIHDVSLSQYNHAIYNIVHVIGLFI